VKAFDFPPGFDSEVKNIAIDFDGVIHNSDKGFFDGTCYGDPIPGSLEAVAKIAQSFEIVIFTAKAKQNRPLVNGKTGTELVVEWLEKYGIMKYVKEVTSEKPRALLYIDDNGYRFENWQSTLEFMEKM
jgi:ribonucleotide monophosphatase NagD (HAD superfamily)